MTKRFLLICSVVLALGIISMTILPEEKYKMLGIGTSAPEQNYKMTDVSGKDLSLSDMKQENGLLVIFSCNTCPFVIQWEDRYPGLGEVCKKNNIGMVLVNSNEAKRDKADSMDEMKKHYEEKGYNSFYVVDEKSKLANAFGAKTTPHVYLFDGKMNLAYRGLIDDNSSNPKKVEKTYLNDAITKMVKGEKIDPMETPAKGCSIKRVSI